MKIGNWPLMMLALEHIIKHADQYSQGNWRSDCGTFRCVAGWVAFFAGWRDVTAGDTPNGYFCGVSRTGRYDDAEAAIPIEDAALMALELDPEIYGAAVNDDERSDAMDALAYRLFGGGLELGDILSTVLDLMRADGITPTPLIEAEMRRLGVLTPHEGVH